MHKIKAARNFVLQEYKVLFKLVNQWTVSRMILSIIGPNIINTVYTYSAFFLEKK